MRLIGSYESVGRMGVFSFLVLGHHANDVAESFAEKDICLRAGHHCTEPFHRSLDLSGTVRMSISIYTTAEDVQKFFAHLDTFL